MNIYLCGQKHFGRSVLELLLSRTDVSVIGVSAPVVTADGREDRTWGGAILHGIPRQVAGSLRAETLPPKTDLIVCAHSHDFLGRKTLSRIRLGAIGYHPSLLPLHRGRDAVRWTIRDRDRVAGGSVFWLNATVDGGPIAAQDWCFVRPSESPESLWRRELHPMGLRLIGRVLDDLAACRMVRIPQDHTLATWEPSMDAPPLFRPELPQIGNGPSGFRVVLEREHLADEPQRR